MEKWKVITAAAAVGVATVGGLVVSSSVAFADRVGVSSSAMSTYTTDMTTFCAGAATMDTARGTGSVAAAMCAQPH